MRFCNSSESIFEVLQLFHEGSAMVLQRYLRFCDGFAGGGCVHSAVVI